jgi:signal transduction histidine kinase
MFYAMKPEEFIQQSSSLTRARILFIGGASDISVFVSESLKDEFILAAVGGIVTGLARFAETPTDLIIIDDTIGDANAAQVTRDIRSRPDFEDVPILVLTREADYVRRAEMLREGVQDYVLKPFTKDELLFRVRNLVALRDLKLSNRVKDEFVAAVSHELRTPLTAIHGWVQVLRTAGADAAVCQRALDSIQRNTEIQVSVIEDLLEMSRIETGTLKLDMQEVDIRSVIEDLLESFRLTANTKRLVLTARFDEGPTYVFGDPNRLRQIILNLLNNAVKFTPTGGTVEVSVRRLPSHIEIEVADTGRGIDSEFLAPVSDRFRQDRRAQSRKDGGLGLGLAIVKSLVELHGGTVLVESAGEGKGVRFRVGIPRPPQVS